MFCVSGSEDQKIPQATEWKWGGMLFLILTCMVGVEKKLAEMVMPFSGECSCCA